MELTHLKAAAQLAEMNHKADPTNGPKKETFEKAQTEYETALADQPTEPISAEPDSDKTSQEDTTEQRRLLGLFEEAGALSIEELEEMLKAKKAEKRAADDQAKAEKKAADDQAKAEKKADKEAEPIQAEETKKNETQN